MDNIRQREAGNTLFGRQTETTVATCQKTQTGKGQGPVDRFFQSQITLVELFQAMQKRILPEARIDQMGIQQLQQGLYFRLYAPALEIEAVFRYLEVHRQIFPGQRAFEGVLVKAAKGAFVDNGFGQGPQSGHIRRLRRPPAAEVYPDSYLIRLEIRWL